MSIEAPFPDDLPNAVTARRALIKTDELQGKAWGDDQEAEKFIAIYNSCPSFLCGDLVVVHSNGTITWGHQAKDLSMEPLTAVRGCLFLFLYENKTAACLQMDDGPTNQRLYHDQGKNFIQFLRHKILPDAFAWYANAYGKLTEPDTTPVFIADERFGVLDYNNPAV